jgi:NAD(P)-dependent dehydrogenase (short-subunit alcohol dehydrogenase family)
MTDPGQGGETGGSGASSSGELRFDGRVAVVTGAGRGIGREEALLLGRRGARVVVNDWGRTGDGRATLDHVAEEVADEIRAAGGEAVADTNDVGTAEGATAVVEHALDEWGRIDVLVNNAGAAIVAGSPAELTDTGVEFTVRTHLFSTIWTCRRAWPEMVHQGRGRIVNTSSATMLGVKNSWDYPASKGGVLGYTRSLAVTGKPLGITVNCIMPMAYTRPMHGYPDVEVRNWMAESFPASEIAPLVAFLAHDDVPCTGECFAVGAGRAARVAIVAAPGYQREDGPLTVEDVRDHWDEVVDLDDAVLMRHSRDETAMYRGRATWSGSNAGYDD